jgi:hypothetical protein
VNKKKKKKKRSSRSWVSVLPLSLCGQPPKTYLERWHVAKHGVVLLAADVDLLLASMQRMETVVCVCVCVSVLAFGS